MTLSEIRAILAESDIRLTKSLGQNFLHDGNQLRRIVAAGELTPSDQVLANPLRFVHDWQQHA